MNSLLHRRFEHGRFMLHGRPYLIVGGELHNSGSSTLAAITESLDAAALMGVNTVLAPVAWESIEPEEGVFDFSIVDALIGAARTQLPARHPALVRNVEERDVELRAGLGQTRCRSLSAHPHIGGNAHRGDLTFFALRL